jgi:hypothetical protein
MRYELLLLYGLIIVAGACLSRWVTVYGVALASIGLGVTLGVATYGDYLPMLHALLAWALFQVAYGVAAVAFDPGARRQVLKSGAWTVEAPLNGKTRDPGAP